jgi:hypothetical protein
MAGYRTQATEFFLVLFQHVVLFCDISIVRVLRLIVVPLPAGKTSFAVNYNIRAPLSLVSTTEELLDRKVAAPV